MSKYSCDCVVGDVDVAAVRGMTVVDGMSHIDSQALRPMIISKIVKRHLTVTV